MVYTIPMPWAETLKLFKGIIIAEGLGKNVKLTRKEKSVVVTLKRIATSNVELWYKQSDGETTFGVQSKDLARIHRKAWEDFERTLGSVVKRHGGHANG